MNRIKNRLTLKELVLDDSLGRIGLGYFCFDESFESLSQKLFESLLFDDDENFRAKLS